jgi:mannonate dehydratase
MKLCEIFTPLSDRNLRLAAQAGYEGVVLQYPGLDLDELLATQRRIESFGLRILVVERLIPHMKFVHNLPGRDEQIEGFKQLIRNLGKARIPVLCYNWMPDDDWQRTSLDVKERGGALVTTFDANAPSAVPHDTGFEIPIHSGHVTSAEDLWKNLRYFLDQVVPVAEESGVKLALHPDDPPMSPLRGQPRIMIGIDELEQLVNLHPSPSNCICFCQGTLSARADIDIPKSIARLGRHIVFAHFRDIVGSLPSFTESFIDNGKTDMACCMRAYLALPHSDEICIRPDHVPTMEGETNEHPGYEMLGRLHAVGYMKGLIDAIKSR